MRKIIYNKFKNFNEDRISMLILSSFFIAFLLLSGCGSRETVRMRSREEMEQTMSVSEEAEEEKQAEPAVEEADELKTAETKNVIVHICGAVNYPGVYELTEGDRVIDAVNRAQGLTADACTEAVNLSEKLTDAQRIYIPTKQEVAGMTATGLWQGQDMSDENANRLININTADEKTLMQIKGVGETRAKSIISYREAHGSFEKIEDIKNVSGIGEASFEKMKDMITVG